MDLDEKDIETDATVFQYETAINELTKLDLAKGNIEKLVRGIGLDIPAVELTDLIEVIFEQIDESFHKPVERCKAIIDEWEGLQQNNYKRMVASYTKSGAV